MPELDIFLKESPGPQMNAQQIAAINVAKREYQKEYLEYWNSTSELTGTGRPVDGFFCPVAPFPAAQRGKAYYAGYTVFANLLDYGSIVIPVTIADKTADTIDAGYDPLNDMDKAIHDECKFCFIKPSLLYFVPHSIFGFAHSEFKLYALHTQMTRRFTMAPTSVCSLLGGDSKKRD